MSFGPPQYGQNPYQPPQGGSSYRGNTAGLRSQLKIVGIAMMVLGGISILASVINGIINLIKGIAMYTGDIPSRPGVAFGTLLGVGLMVVLIFVQAAIIKGGLSMSTCEGYRSAQTAAILSVIPCCSSCVVLGIPFGIWALFLLYNPDVKSLFLDAPT